MEIKITIWYPIKTLETVIEYSEYKYNKLKNERCNRDEPVLVTILDGETVVEEFYSYNFLYALYIEDEELYDIVRIAELIQEINNKYSRNFSYKFLGHDFPITYSSDDFKLFNKLKESVTGDELNCVVTLYEHGKEVNSFKCKYNEID